MTRINHVQGNIYCASNGEYCEIDCSDDESCVESTIYDESITFDRDFSGYDSTIYAPDSHCERKFVRILI